MSRSSILGINQIRRFLHDRQYRQARLIKLVGLEHVYGYHNFGLLIVFLFFLFFSFLRSESPATYINNKWFLSFLGLLAIYSFRHIKRAIYIISLRKKSDYRRSLHIKECLKVKSKIMTSAIVRAAHLFIKQRKRMDGQIKLIDNSKVGLPKAWKLYDLKIENYRLIFVFRYYLYTVFEADLRQKVPHLIFDSAKTKRHQFKRVFKQARKLTLDSYIDKTFTIHAPDNHDIDILSFVTPEVVEAINNLKDYDLELVGDRLFCYAPFLRRDELAGFQQKCSNLYLKLVDNFTQTKKPRAAAVQAPQLASHPSRYASKLPHLAVAVILSVFALFIVFASIKFINSFVLEKIEARAAIEPVIIAMALVAAIAILFIGALLRGVRAVVSNLRDDLRETTEPEWRPARRPARLKRGAKLQCLRCNKECLHRKLGRGRLAQCNQCLNQRLVAPGQSWQSYPVWQLAAISYLCSQLSCQHTTRFFKIRYHDAGQCSECHNRQKTNALVHWKLALKSTAR